MLDKYSLYGIPYSLYTGCARPYLIKDGISFRDLDEVLDITLERRIGHENNLEIWL